MFGIAFMVYQHKFMGIDIYKVGFFLLLIAAVMTIWSMFIYLKAAWPSMRREIDSA
jgi:CDP-diacylglycerol--glycerol-3-phosphate 3-phosphatidyltransferase/cardiolipin synthase